MFHSVSQTLIGFVKGVESETKDWPIVGDDVGAPSVTASNSTQAKGMAAGAFVVRLGAAAATEDESAGAEVAADSETVQISGFAKHGINRAIGDGAKRAGVKPEAILDAIRNPQKVVSGIDNQGRPYQIFTGKDARVVMNPQTHQIVSTNPLSGAGAH